MNLQHKTLANIGLCAAPLLLTLGFGNPWRPIEFEIDLARIAEPVPTPVENANCPSMEQLVGTSHTVGGTLKCSDVVILQGRSALGRHENVNLTDTWNCL